ncbi:hypothetical protein LUZ60_015065 [Juncus effusus]|nr:hypothetical protein LUZ60_015065 [Juncus effusus]
MGEKFEEKVKEKKGESGEGKKEGGKDGPAPIVLTTDLHCEGCALKVKKAVKGFGGVDKVSTDLTTNKITVTGTADPWELKERLQSKIKKRVELISPNNPPKKKEEKKEKEKGKDKDKAKDKKDGGKDEKSKEIKGEKGKEKGGKGEKEKDKGEKEKEKPKEIPESTVMLKIRLHCEGCVDRIKRHILKIKGVKDVAIDAAKDLVTVKGTMDTKTLPSTLKEKLKRSVEVVAGNKKNDDGKKENKEKKDDSKEKDGGNKEKGKSEGEKANQNQNQAPIMQNQPMFMEDPMGYMAQTGQMGHMGYNMPPQMGYMPPQMGYMPQTGYMGQTGQMGHDNYAPPPQYGYQSFRPEMAHAPQMFSDENPNACSVM